MNQEIKREDLLAEIEFGLEAIIKQLQKIHKLNYYEIIGVLDSLKNIGDFDNSDLEEQE